MTEEEIRALQDSVTALEQERDNLIAERDSLREELDETRTNMERLTEENAETKKLNFTLARQLNRQPERNFEETLLNAMGY